MTNFTDDLLTTHQLEGILKVDRITIYRMLGDGRLRGFKVGGQWRFSRSEVESWIQGQCLQLDELAANESGKKAGQTFRALPLSCVQAVQSVFADAMDIATVTTDPEGQAITEISNGCDYCSLIRSSKEGQQQCSSFWKSLGDLDVKTCYAGLAGTGQRIMTKGKWVGTVTVCQLDLRTGEEHDPGWGKHLSKLASELNLPKKGLRADAVRIRTIRPDQTPRILRLVKQVAETFSKIGEERLALLGRLEQIAEISHFEPQ